MLQETRKPLYSLIPPDHFKSVLGIDDREDKLSRFCLITATLTIEQYCKRRLLRRKYFERIEYHGDLHLPFKEYPVSKVLAAYTLNSMGKVLEILEPDFYSILPDCGTDLDIPFSLSLSPALKQYPGFSAVKVLYYAGYNKGSVPADLASACMELASWNMNRYRGRRIGMTGTVMGNGKEGEHFEMSMPENVKTLLEPYRRKVL